MANERGQSTPFFLCSLALMTVMVGTLVNVGQAINRRIALQVAADAGAWTGATNMAIGMNAVADVNQWRRDIEPLISVGLPIGGPIGLGGTIISIWEFGTTIINFVDLGIQLGYAKKPYDEAARVTWYNNQDLFPGEQLRWYEGYRLGWISDGEDEVSDEVPFSKSRDTVCPDQPFLSSTFFALPCVVDEDPIERDQFYLEPCFPLGECPSTYHYVRWYEKSGREVSFVWIVEAPEAKPIYNPFNVFGEDAIPVMRAGAVAKPVGGDILDGDSDYRVKLKPLTSADMYFAPAAVLNGGNYDPVFDTWRRIMY